MAGQALFRCATASLLGLECFLAERRWVGPRNRYAKDTIATIKAEDSPGPLVAPKQLSEYVAASIVLHASDGWSFFGAAASSLLHGDPHRARHLAYYAELRAAMSMLAAFGVGVFLDRHFIIDGPNSAAPLPKKSSTHTFVWDCIEHFGSQNELGELFGSIIQPYGQPLSEWLSPVGGTGVIAPQSREWFLQWNQDLQMPNRDHDARNESSYRPDGIPSAWYPDAPTVLEFVSDLWSALEPEPSLRFEQIDRHILRLAVERSYRAQYGDRRPSRRPPFDDFVSQVVNNQALNPAAHDFWTDYLLRRTSPQDHKVLSVVRTFGATGGVD